MPKHNDKAFKDKKKECGLNHLIIVILILQRGNTMTTRIMSGLNATLCLRKNEIVFDNYKIVSVYRFRTLLRCVVEIRSI